MKNIKFKGIILFFLLTLPSIGLCGSMQYLCGLIQPNGMLKATNIYTRVLGPASGGQQFIKSSSLKKMNGSRNLKLTFESPEMGKKMTDSQFINMLRDAQKQSKGNLGLCYHGPVKGSTLVVRDIED